MDLKTYKAALMLSANYGESLSIGGGEPTIHPHFWEFLGLALAEPYIDSIWLATNGKKKDTAIALAGLARRGVIGVDLSQDPFHESIDPAVIAAFTQGKKTGWEHSSGSDRDCRGIRDVSYNVINVGRAKRNQLGMDDKTCVCDDLFIDPDGNLFSCGCKKEQFGTVFKPAIPEEYLERGSRCPKENRRYIAEAKAMERQELLAES